MRHGEIVCDRSTPGPSTVFTRPHNRQRTMLWTQEHKRDDNTGRAPLFSAADLSVYLTSLFTPLYYLPPAALGQRHKNREMTNVPVSRWLNTIFTKCPQFSQNAHNLMFFVFTKFSSSLQSAFKFDFSSSQISGWILSQCALTLSNFNNINLVVFALSSFSKPIIAILAIVPVDKVVSRD